MDQPESNLSTDAEPVPPRSFTETEVKTEEGSETSPKAPCSCVDEKESHYHVTTEDVSGKTFPNTLEMSDEIQQIKLGDDNQAGNFDDPAADKQAGYIDFPAYHHQAGNVDAPADGNNSGKVDVLAERNQAGNNDVLAKTLPSIFIPEDWHFKEFTCKLARKLSAEDLDFLKARFSGTLLTLFI